MIVIIIIILRDDFRSGRFVYFFSVVPGLKSWLLHVFLLRTVINFVLVCCFCFRPGFGRGFWLVCFEFWCFFWHFLASFSLGYGHVQIHVTPLCVTCLARLNLGLFPHAFPKPRVSALFAAQLGRLISVMAWLRFTARAALAAPVRNSLRCLWFRCQGPSPPHLLAHLPLLPVPPCLMSL